MRGAEDADGHGHHRINARREADDEPARKRSQRGKQRALGQRAREGITSFGEAAETGAAAARLGTSKQSADERERERKFDSDCGAESLHDVCTWKTGGWFQSRGA